MNHYILATFAHVPQAQRAALELKYKGHGDGLSVVMKTDKHEPLLIEAQAIYDIGIQRLKQSFGKNESLQVSNLGQLLVTGELLSRWGVSHKDKGSLMAGLRGALEALDIPREIAQAYKDRVDSGAVLVSVKFQGVSDLEQIKAALKRHGGLLIHDTSKQSQLIVA